MRRSTEHLVLEGCCVGGYISKNQRIYMFTSRKGLSDDDLKRGSVRCQEGFLVQEINTFWNFSRNQKA